MMRDYLEYAKDHEIVNTKVSVYLIKRIGRYLLTTVNEYLKFYISMSTSCIQKQDMKNY